MIVVEQWLKTCPSRPLVFRADSRCEPIEVNIGLGSKNRVTAVEAAEILGMHQRTFSRHHFFGLKRGTDRKFSRLTVERQRDAMR